MTWTSAWWQEDVAPQAREAEEDRYAWQGQGELFQSVGRTASAFHGPADHGGQTLSTTRVGVERRDLHGVPPRADSRPIPVRVQAAQRPLVAAARTPAPVAERVTGRRTAPETESAARFLHASGVVHGLFEERVRFALMGKSMGERLRLWGGSTDSTTA